MARSRICGHIWQEPWTYDRSAHSSSQLSSCKYPSSTTARFSKPRGAFLAPWCGNCTQQEQYEYGRWQWLDHWFFFFFYIVGMQSSMLELKVNSGNYLPHVCTTYQYFGAYIPGRGYCAWNDLQIYAYHLERNRLNKYILEHTKASNNS